MSTLKIKKGDTVQVIAGKEKGKSGKVIEIDRKKGRVRIEGVNMIVKHSKPSMTNQQGGIIETEGSIDISNVMYLDGGKPSRIGFVVETSADGKKTKKRVAKATGKVID